MTDTKKQTTNGQSANDLTVILKGRIKSHERVASDNGDFYSTLLVVPAQDEYSHPKTFAINADAPLGSEGADTEVKVEIRPNNRKKDGRYFHNVSLWRYEENQARPF
jgi:hypothetical protein